MMIAHLGRILNQTEFEVKFTQSATLNLYPTLNVLQNTKWLRRAGLHPERDEPVCVNCGGNTMGLRCEWCKAGFFSSEGGDCVRCQCNGHGDVCDRLTGEDCECRNNTMSDLKPCHHAGKDSCYEFQCNQCKV